MNHVIEKFEKQISKFIVDMKSDLNNKQTGIELRKKIYTYKIDELINAMMVFYEFDIIDKELYWIYRDYLLLIKIRINNFLDTDDIKSIYDTSYWDESTITKHFKNRVRPDVLKNMTENFINQETL